MQVICIPTVCSIYRVKYRFSVCQKYGRYTGYLYASYIFKIQISCMSGIQRSKPEVCVLANLHFDFVRTFFQGKMFRVFLCIVEHVKMTNIHLLPYVTVDGRLSTGAVPQLAVLSALCKLA